MKGQGDILMLSVFFQERSTKMTAMALSAQVSANERTLHVAFELGSEKWILAFAVEGGRGLLQRTVLAGDLKGVLEHIGKLEERFGLPPDSGVLSVYEAGRDGFWLHRWLLEQGFRSQVVDSASIKVDRRKRRVKTDRLDAHELVTMLLRQSAGERKVWSVVQVPSREAEDLRRLQRQMGRLKVDYGRHLARIRAVLVTYGIQQHPEVAVKELRTLRSPAGEALGEHARGEIRREWKSAQLIAKHIKQISVERHRLERTAGSEGSPKTFRAIAILVALKGIGTEAAWMLATEMFGWRKFQNRKQIASAAGLCGSHYSSGKSEHDQGISKAGNRRVRSMMVEIAWLWLRYQSESSLTKWFYAAVGTKRLRRNRIVGVARKLLIALYRWVEYGELPQGAVLSPSLPAHVRRVLGQGWVVRSGTEAPAAA